MAAYENLNTKEMTTKVVAVAYVSGGLQEFSITRLKRHGKWSFTMLVVTRGSCLRVVNCLLIDVFELCGCQNYDKLRSTGIILALSRLRFSINNNKTFHLTAQASLLTANYKKAELKKTARNMFTK